MNGKNLFRALEYVDDRYLDMVDAAAQEATDMKQKHFSGRKTILYVLAAAICVSLLTVTAAAASARSGSGCVPPVPSRVTFSMDAPLFQYFPIIKRIIAQIGRAVKGRCGSLPPWGKPKKVETPRPILSYNLYERGRRP